MGNPCKLLWDDQSDDIIFSGPVWPISLTNLQDPRLSKVARSTDATTANTQFFMSFPDDVSIAGLVLVRTNSTENAQIRVTTYFDNVFSLQKDVTSLLPIWTGAPGTFRNIDAKGIDAVVLFDTPFEASYWWVEIIDTANPDTYWQAGNIGMFKALTPEFNFSDNAFVRNPNTEATYSVGSTPAFSRHRNMRSWSISMPYEGYEKAWDEIDVLNEVHGIDRPVYFVPFPDDTLRRSRQAFLGTLAKPSPMRMLAMATTRVATAFEINEYV